MRKTLLVAGPVLLVAVLAFWYTRFSTNRQLPGLDRSDLLAGATPSHVAALRGGSPAERKYAATCLWKIGDQAREAVPALLEVAKDPDPEVRTAVLRALGRTSAGTQAAIPALVEALADETAEARAVAAGALAEIWSANNSSGRRDFNSDAPKAHPVLPVETAVRPAIQPLTAALGDGTPEVRVQAATALSEVGPLAEPAVKDLTRVAGGDMTEKARLYAAIALGNVGPEARTAVPVLLDRLRNEPVDGVRANIAVALGQIHFDAPAVVPALVHMFLTEEFGDVRSAAVQGISSFGPEARPALDLLRAAAKDPKYQQKEQLLRDVERLLKQLERNLPKEGAAAPNRGRAP
jgi:HEAT repeat protein